MKKPFNKNSRNDGRNKKPTKDSDYIKVVKTNINAKTNTKASTNTKSNHTTTNDNIIYGMHPVEEALNTNPKIIEKIYIKTGLSNKDLPSLLTICRDNKIPVTEISGDDKMRDLAGTSYHQGLIAITRDFEYIEIEEVLKLIDNNRENNKPSLIIIMDELTDTQNVGAIIRTAVGVGATAVIVPKHRQAPITGATHKASAGMVSHIPIARVANLGVAIDKLKDSHVWVAALAMSLPLDLPYSRQKPDSLNKNDMLWSLDMKGDMAIIVGNEGEGVHKHNIENSDYVLSIPMESRLESLNASVSSAIVMYEWKRQNFSTV